MEDIQSWPAADFVNVRKSDGGNLKKFGWVDAKSHSCHLEKEKKKNVSLKGKVGIKYSFSHPYYVDMCFTLGQVFIPHRRPP